MIFTRLYSLDIKDIEHEVAHLFEHLLLRALDAYLKRSGIDTHLTTHWHGETYSGYMLIHFETTSPKAADLFDTFISSQTKFRAVDIQTELMRIECEEKVLLSVPSSKSLHSALNHMNNLSWENMKESTSAALRAEHFKDFNHGVIIKKQPAAKNFRDITLVLGIEDASPDDTALFSRLGLVLSDIFWDLINEDGMYVRGSSDAFRDPYSAQKSNHALICMIIGAKRGAHNLKRVQYIAQEGLLNFQDARDTEALHTEFKIRESLSVTNDFTSRAYDKLGVFVSQKRITDLATKENIDSLLDKLVIKALATRSEHWQYL